MKNTTKKLIKMARIRRAFMSRKDKQNRRESAALLLGAWREYGDKYLSFI